MNRRDLSLLRLMLEAAHDARSFIAGESRQSLDQDKKLLFALTKAMDTISRIAAQVSDEAKAECPDIAWRELAELSPNLTHAYFHIDADMLWQTATKELPQIVVALERAIAASDKA